MASSDSPEPILLVEDNPDDVELTRDALADNGIANPLVVARDGVEALTYLHDADPLPRVVLLDLNMPRLGGIEVLRRMRAERRTRSIPVVILTTSDEERDLVDAYELGVNSYVQKPVGFGEFHDVVRTLGLYWLLHNKLPRAG
jgi:two-component system response regulator